MTAAECNAQQDAGADAGADAGLDAGSDAGQAGGFDLDGASVVCGAPTTLQTSGSTFGIEVVVEPSGYPTVLWVARVVDQSEDLYFSRYNLETGWSAPSLVENEEDGSVSTPISAGVDDAGRVVAAWIQADITQANRPRLARFVPGIGWGPTLTPPILDGGNASGPRVVVEPGGTATLIWQQYVENLQKLVSVRSYVDGGFSGPVAISSADAGNNLSDVDVAIDRHGNVVVVWSESNGPPPYRLLTTRYSPDAGWGPVTLLDSLLWSGPRLALDPSGTGFAAWRRYPSDGGNSLLVASNFSLEAGWASPTQIDQPLGSSSTPQVFVNPVGAEYAIWRYTTSGPTPTTLMAANRFDPGNGWGQASLFDSLSGSTYASDPLLVGEFQWGNAVVIWTETRDGGSEEEIYAKRLYPQNDWLRKTRIEGSRGASFPRLAITSTNVAYVVWIERDGGSGLPRAAVCQF